jgi:hypothetical protein
MVTTPHTYKRYKPNPTLYSFVQLSLILVKGGGRSLPSPKPINATNLTLHYILLCVQLSLILVIVGSNRYHSPYL